MVATTGQGIAELKDALERSECADHALELKYSTDLEAALGQIVAAMKGDYPLDKRAMALLVLQGDTEMENICTLLGHPKLCPHGKPIPPGRCCQIGERQPKRVVASLAELSPGQGGRVAYIYAEDVALLNKLMSMGVLPGTAITLLQSFPSHVFQVGNAQFAVDRSVASAIYVRLEEAQEKTASPAPHRRKWRWGR